jgi:hypothetical protein
LLFFFSPFGAFAFYCSPRLFSGISPLPHPNRPTADQKPLFIANAKVLYATLVQRNSYVNDDCREHNDKWLNGFSFFPSFLPFSYYYYLISCARDYKFDNNTLSTFGSLHGPKGRTENTEGKWEIKVKLILDLFLR